MNIKNFIARGLRAMARRLAPEDDIAKFFKLSYAERVRVIKESYSHDTKTKYLGDYFSRTAAQRRNELQTNFRPYFDHVHGYAMTLRPRVFMQLGAFLASEAQLLAEEGFEGRIIASDYDATHLAWLKAGYAQPPLDRIEYRCVDLEAPGNEDFADVDMVAAIAVLSNIQPEGMAKLLTVLSSSRVKCVIIGDMYHRASLSIAPDKTESVPLTAARNWAHPYLALGRKYGFDSHFFPDFTYSAYVDARGIFVLTRGVSKEQHRSAVAAAWQRYIGRHDEIWAVYA